MKKINLAIITNNFNKDYDGIGAYAHNIAGNFSEKIFSEIYTSECRGDNSKARKFTTLGMTKAIGRAKKNINNIDAVIIEYPFVEWNPIIVPSLLLLRRKCTALGRKIFLSLHEYSRVNALRRMIIRFLIRISDCIFVSDFETKKKLSKFGKVTYLRDIPTNICSVEKNVEKKNNQFVFFGLINKAKAFQEMIEAWDVFNNDRRYCLNILTSTEYHDVGRHMNVEFDFGFSNEEIMKRMSNSRYCIIPIRPEVDRKNATFKTGALAGCICIGAFCEEYRNLPFVVNMSDYSSAEFEKAFYTAVNMDVCILEEKSMAAVAFGNMYTPHAVANNIENVIIKELDRK